MRKRLADRGYQLLGRIPHLRKGRMIILGQGRSGGTTLLRLLAAHPGFRYFDEPLCRPVDDPFALLQGIGRRYRLQGRAIGCKIKHWHLTDTQGVPSAVAFLQRAVSAGWLIVLLQRENVARQALASIARRVSGGTRYQRDPATRVEIPLDHILPWIGGHLSHAAIESEITRAVPNIALSYERDLLDCGNRQRTVDQILANLGLTSVDVSTAPLRTEPDDLSLFVRNASEVEQHLREIGYPYAAAEV